MNKGALEEIETKVKFHFRVCVRRMLRAAGGLLEGREGLSQGTPSPRTSDTLSPYLTLQCSL